MERPTRPLATTKDKTMNEGHQTPLQDEQRRIKCVELVASSGKQMEAQQLIKSAAEIEHYLVKGFDLKASNEWKINEALQDIECTNVRGVSHAKKMEVLNLVKSTLIEKGLLSK